MAKKIEKKEQVLPGITYGENMETQIYVGSNFNELDGNEKLIKEADSVVFKHKLILALVDQCLKNHKKEHDEVLAEKLYKHFDKELQ